MTKIPKWFVIGCGLLVLNLALVLGGIAVRHAAAGDPEKEVVGEDASQAADKVADKSESQSKPEGPSAAEVDAADLPPVLVPSNSGSVNADEPVTTAPDSPLVLPTVPSLEAAPSMPADSSVIKLEDFKRALQDAGGLGGTALHTDDLLKPLDEMLDERSSQVPESLSHMFFEAIKLRLQTTEHLNQSASGLVEEAGILYQRGEVEKARELLGNRNAAARGDCQVAGDAAVDFLAAFEALFPVAEPHRSDRY